MIKREVKLEMMLNRLIENGGYSRNRQPILDSIAVTAAALSQYSRGRTRPSFDKLVALADFFGVSMDFLVYGEPINGPVDPAPIARYVEQAFTDVSAQANRHSDLVARIGRLLADRVDEVAKEIDDSRSAGIEGLIEREETLRVERHSQQANIITFDLEPNIITMDGGSVVPGQFFPIVTGNLLHGRTYRFLLAGDLTHKSPAVARLRELIADSVGGDRLHAQCSFRTATIPMASTAVLYRLDIATFKAAEPALFAQFEKYLVEDTWLGYLNRPNDDSRADMLMAPSHLERAREAFQSFWGNALS